MCGFLFPGYMNELCQEDIDECSLTDPVCYNGGTCTNIVGSFTCACVDGYEGHDCTVKVSINTKVVFVFD